MSDEIESLSPEEYEGFDTSNQTEEDSGDDNE